MIASLANALMPSSSFYFWLQKQRIPIGQHDAALISFCFQKFEVGLKGSESRGSPENICMQYDASAGWCCCSAYIMDCIQCTNNTKHSTAAKTALSASSSTVGVHKHKHKHTHSDTPSRIGTCKTTENKCPESASTNRQPCPYSPASSQVLRPGVS